MIDAVRFSGQANGVSTGRFPDGARQWSVLTGTTFGAPNASVRVSDIVINEIMYHPISEDSNDEFIELYNRGESSMDLSGWRLNGEVSYTVPAGMVLAPGGYLVIAKNSNRLIANYSSLSEGLRGLENRF